MRMPLGLISMAKPNPAQEQLLVSMVQATLRNTGGEVQLRVEGPTGVLCHLVRPLQADEGWMIIQPPRPGFLLEPEVLPFIQQGIQEGGTWVIVEEETTITRLGLKGNAVTRDVEKRKEPRLKTAAWAVGKSTHLDAEEAAPLLKAIGLMTPEGEIKAPMRRKFKQVNHFLDQISPLLKQRNTSKPFTLIDCGCGKTYLGFVLFWHLRRTLGIPARFFGVDVAEKLILQNQQRANQLGLDGMDFVCSTIQAAPFPNQPDLVVSLHACDTATDEALAAGVGMRARHIVAVPCCQHELAQQIQDVPRYSLSGKHGIFVHRFGDLLTDMMRALFLEAQGYVVTAGEFVSPIETPKNLMLRASRGNPLQDKRREEYAAFKAFYKINPSLDQFCAEREALAKR
ncbi:MAG: SAM-dependent methyltransferase [bacterium]|nr:SAM-dependent methyltransferase [bacterium]